MPALTHVQTDWLRPLIQTVRPCLFDAGKAGLTLAQCFEPGRFNAKQAHIPAGDMLMIKAADGWCFALVRSVDEFGCWVLERESAPALALVDEVPTRSRRAAA